MLAFHFEIARRPGEHADPRLLGAARRGRVRRRERQHGDVVAEVAQERGLAQRPLGRPDHDDAATGDLVAIADRAEADMAGADQAGERGQLRLLVDETRRNEHAGDMPAAIAPAGEEAALRQRHQRLDTTAFEGHAIARGLPSQPFEKIRARDPVRKAGIVVRFGNSGGAALAGIDEAEAAPELRQ